MPRLPAGQAVTAERARAREFLHRSLRHGWFTPAAALEEQAAREGINVRTLRRAADDLGVDKQRQASPDARRSRVMWRLPR